MIEALGPAEPDTDGEFQEPFAAGGEVVLLEMGLPVGTTSATMA